ncbi:MAG: MmgE/PrpD family protein [Candidatus Micrarchaeota archaeon]|nr:MmgE/PrpD family protein [Candidatus Micrarchaeota archaeon]
MVLADRIYAYSHGVMEGKLAGTDSDAIKKSIVDSIFVSYGARRSEPIKIAMSALLPSAGKFNSTIYFSRKTASADIATFINGSMTRYLDYSDTYLSREALHPSDNIPPILSCADSLGIKGASALKAIKAAYQVVCALSDAVSIRNRGWDHVTYVSISAAAGLAGLLGLDEKRFVNSLNLAVNNNISMRQTRAGELSMWKGCTAADASRNSVFAVLLAREGFTGPAPIFEGEMGFFKQVSGRFELDLKRDRITRTMIKNYPVEYHAMSGVDAALRLRGRIEGKIKEIKVDTFSVAHKIIVEGGEKLRPKTKETADHSLPYMIAYTLLHGAPGLNSYAKRYLSDKRIANLIGMMRFRISKEFDSMYPEYLPIKITVLTDRGAFEEEVRVPKGHFRDPYSWGDLKNKGISILGDEDSVSEIINLGRSIENRYVSELFDVMGNVDPKG